MEVPRPMLCTEAQYVLVDDGGVPVPQVPIAPGWVIEPKFDGWRFLFCVDGDGTVRAFAGRNATQHTGEVPNVEKCLRELPPGTIIDGELICDYAPSIPSALAQREGARFVAFDILSIGTTSVVHFPWHARRDLLETANRLRFDGFNVSLARVEEASQEQHDVWVKAGYEGSVAKRVESPYRPGKRSRDWVKVKPQRTSEARVVGFEPGRGGREGLVGALRVVLLDTGRETTVKYDLDEPDPSLVGRVLELRHHGETADGKRRHPVFHRWRPDREGRGR